MRRSIAVIGMAAALCLSMTGVASAHGPHGDHDGGGNNVVNGQRIIADECSDKALRGFPEHNGFQPGVGTKKTDPRCVDTEFGVVSQFEKNPSLLIVGAPTEVAVNADIVLQVSTQNLVRDRFLGAAAGGYYIESGSLDRAGFTRGHFHTACRQISGNNAPDPARQDRFVATEDSKGGNAPDTVTVTLKGFATPGVVQCASWAGDGSHRVPMMSFANEIPAFDVVRLNVK